jgi:NADPH:quinone reductase-like Zn-dependent oxidoreductase
MKAAFLTEQGSLDHLHYGDRPDPTPGRREALIRVKACALNRVDLFGVMGQKGVRLQCPRILGRDFAGEVVALGEDADGPFQPGGRVLVYPHVSCGQCEPCRRGRDNMCVRTWVIGLASDGGLAELARVPVDNVYPLPANLSFEEGASVPTTFVTAWHMLVRRARFQPGEDVLVMAAGSGVGSAAIQIAHRLGARVFATAGSDEKLALARELGAEHAINYQTEDFSQRVLALTGGRGVDVIVDHVGASVWERNFASLAVGGRLVNCGVSSGHRVELHMGQLFTRQLSILGSTMGTRADVLDVLRLLERGELRPTVARTFPLSEARRAFETMASSDFFGKLVVVP